MKRLFFLVIVLALSLTMLASCDAVSGIVCQHRDADDDSLCDMCGQDYTDGADVDFCQHRDKTDDGRCDKCGKTYSDGADGDFCQHRDEDDSGLCDYCNGVYSDGDDTTYPHQHRDKTDDGKCDRCGTAYSDGTDLTNQHSFTAWTNYSANGNVSCEERLFYRTCETCGDIEWKTGTYAEHIFSTSIVEPTCKDEGAETKTCSICGLVETNSIPTTSHTYSTTYSASNSFHWLECIHCGAKKNEAEHTSDSDGFCSVCNRPVGATEGVIYDKSANDTYAEVIGYSGSAKRVIIADTYNGLPVKSIYKEAFRDTDITEVVIPDSVTSIGECAFHSCSSLTSIVIPDSVTSIGNHAFASCSSLMSVVIGDSVTSIGDYAFAWCYSLTSVTIEGAPTIGMSAFLYCNSALYTEYELGRYVGTPDNPYKILVELTNANLSTYTIHESTEIIGGSVFSRCARLTNITIPDNVKTISSYAFSCCSSLTSVVIPNSVTSIGNDAFESCNSLTSVVIGDSVTSIGEYAFENCDSLTSVVIPDSVTNIGSSAFSVCSNLTIYCEAESKPERWSSDWNRSNRPVVWGYEASEE